MAPTATLPQGGRRSWAWLTDLLNPSTRGPVLTSPTPARPRPRGPSTWPPSTGPAPDPTGVVAPAARWSLPSAQSLNAE